MTDTGSFLMGGGSAAAKFETPGTTITGTFVSARLEQQTALDTGEPLTWKDGSPRMQMVVQLATSARDDDEDDGMRSLYVKGSTKTGSRSMHDAVASAVRSSGAKDLEPGGVLSVTYIGDEPSQTRGFNARKLYQATYQRPSADTGGFLGTAPTNTPAPAQAAATPVQPSLPPQVHAAQVQAPMPVQQSTEPGTTFAQRAATPPPAFALPDEIPGMDPATLAAFKAALGAQGIPQQ